MLYDLIKTHAAAAAHAGDWQAVADTLNAKTITRTRNGQPVSLFEVVDTLGVAEANSVLAAFGTTEVGLSGRRRLENQGLDFAHPLAAGLLDQLQASGDISGATANKLRRLSRWMVSPMAAEGLPDADAVTCRAAWIEGVSDDRRIDWRQRVDVALNQLLTSESALGIAELRAIADEASR